MLLFLTLPAPWAFALVHTVRLTSTAAIDAREGSQPFDIERPAAPADTCKNLAFRLPRQEHGRAAVPADLLALRDFGPSALDMGSPAGFSIAPGGRQLAVQVRQANPAANAYCQAILIFDLAKPKAAQRIIVIGNELARASFTLDGLAGFPSGGAVALTPRWSPDGSWLAFLMQEAGTIRLFVTRCSGGMLFPVSGHGANVTDFAWSADGSAITYADDEGLQKARRRLADQGREGYLYDDRFWMLAEPRPFPRGTFADSARVARMAPAGPGTSEDARADNGLASIAQADADKAWVEFDPSPRFAYISRLHVRQGGREIACGYATCTDVGAAWLLPGGTDVVFLRREGFARAQTGIYRWHIDHGHPRRLASTSDAFAGCAFAAHRLLCGRERSDHPRDIAEIDLDDGQIRTIVDLNPEWDEVAPAPVHRLFWKNRFGLEAIGDLVMPSTTPAGAALPLVVVQYDTRGFLRGGIGDEYPIFPLAEAGFAVLSISRPMDYNTMLARSGRPVDQEKLMRDWTDRASVHDSLVTAIKLVQSRVAIDPAHRAITGLSDGASTATYALIHSRLFSLAILGTCCEDPSVTTTAIGPAYEAMLKDYQYPLPWDRNKESWAKISLAMNAQRICAEILIEAADREARMALASLASLRAHRIPAEMYIYPDEYHVKWQPAHRQAIYRRNMAKLITWRAGAPAACPQSD
ncbi:Atxe2 family lasso peptide isopeptidase [Novosphingobium album (ex Liu et al. 2023)]|uniref:Atxe2 family lasso peptide isopeptidase n=1 Tax=Novosphingobium album (ex Liu et al. 2023) TaxID=3031130 RepID=A0ABT5WQG4_9SPHN|nr:Atxe2 family lasso peptide isopeptidase [Novosphingobium album (ex Liu et al. 2023)]MDE8652264.1 Atxe2 family lasso peptide isopeptidase [Novosphingobium album (ex Liu et al. 2023)]